MPSSNTIPAQQWPSTLTLIVFVWAEWHLLEGQFQTKTNNLELPGATLTSKGEFYQVTFNHQGQYIPPDTQCVCLHNLLRSILHLPPSILCVVDKFIRPKKGLLNIIKNIVRHRIWSNFPLNTCIFPCNIFYSFHTT